MLQNEQVSSTLNVTITTTYKGQDIPALNINASLNSSLNSFGLNINIVNLEACKSNPTDVQQQLNDYITNTIKSKMTEAGYPIVLT